MGQLFCARDLSLWLGLLTLMIVVALSGAANTADLSDVPNPGFVQQNHTGDLDEIQDRKVLRALVTHSRTGFFLLNRRPRGLMYELMLEYDKYLNRGISRDSQKIRLTFVPVSFDQLIPSLLDGRGDIAAALLTVTSGREQQMAFATKPNLLVNELVVSHKSIGNLKNIKDLSGKWIYVLSGSSYTEQ